MNSMIVASTATVLNLLLNAMAGYAFARLRWRLRETFFVVVLAVMMLPGLIALIPTFLIVKWTPLAGGNDWLGQGGIGWLDSYQGLILPSVGNGFYVFLLRQFFLTLPTELEDAARVDGANELTVLSRITLPLLGSTIRLTVFLSVIGSFQQFVLAWILTNGGGPVNASQLMATYMYKFGIQSFKLGYGSAIAVVLFGITLIFSLGYQRFITQRDFAADQM
jgi:multiple sugar transport system permease protein